MNWFIKLFSSTLGKKLIMALTGLFLISFLIVHLIGNLQLLHHDGGRAFNTYAEFMGTNPIVQIISKVNFALILMHAIWGLILTVRNRKARGAQGYVVVKNSSPWTSRNIAGAKCAQYSPSTRTFPGSCARWSIQPLRIERGAVKHA